MTVRKYAGDRYTCLAADTKPTNVAYGAVLNELDTRKIFSKVSGSGGILVLPAIGKYCWVVAH